MKLILLGGSSYDCLAQLVLFLKQLAALLGEFHAFIPDELKFLIVRFDLRESLIALALFDMATLTNPPDACFLIFDRLMLGLELQLKSRELVFLGLEALREVEFFFARSDAGHEKRA